MDVLKFLQRNFITRLEQPKSTVGFKTYPTLRDHPLHSSNIWLAGKREDDNAEQLWRIHDGIYDFSTFINTHPGGSDWLNVTRGTDITEAFEAHHISTTPAELLRQYFVKKAELPRNSPFTFHEDGFYNSLKKAIRNEMENIPDDLQNRSKFFADVLLVAFLSLGFLSIKYESYILGGLSGIFLTVTAIAAHNFFHQKDNFRMFYFDLTMMSSREWRVSHVLSHHIYTNTVYDLEISVLEPFFQYLPTKKNFFVRYVSWIYTPVVYSSVYFVYYVRMIVESVTERRFLNVQSYLAFAVFILLYVTSGQGIGIAAKHFCWIQFVSSFFFGLIGLNAGHHHPQVFHDGDEQRFDDSVDWGLYQVMAAMDRTETHRSHFLGMITFGDHVMHHLFPAVDHGKLMHLYPVVNEVFEKFGIKLKKTDALDVIYGQFLQLAKVPKKK